MNNIRNLAVFLANYIGQKESVLFLTWKFEAHLMNFILDPSIINHKMSRSV